MPIFTLKGRLLALEKAAGERRATAAVEWSHAQAVALSMGARPADVGPPARVLKPGRKRLAELIGAGGSA